MIARPRRSTFVALAVAVGLALAAGLAAAQRPAPKTVVDIVKDPGCGCCEVWAKHLQAQGFVTRMTESDDMAAVKTKHAVPAKTRSCHTAVVDGYVLEGHVPASDIQRLLVERPKIAGLAVPGMPIRVARHGSAGDESAAVRRHRLRPLGRDARLLQPQSLIPARWRRHSGGGTTVAGEPMRITRASASPAGSRGNRAR